MRRTERGSGVEDRDECIYLTKFETTRMVIHGRNTAGRHLSSQSHLLFKTMQDRNGHRRDYYRCRTNEYNKIGQYLQVNTPSDLRVYSINPVQYSSIHPGYAYSRNYFRVNQDMRTLKTDNQPQQKITFLCFQSHIPSNCSEYTAPQGQRKAYLKKKKCLKPIPNPQGTLNNERPSDIFFLAPKLAFS